MKVKIFADLNSPEELEKAINKWIDENYFNILSLNFQEVWAKDKSLYSVLIQYESKTHY